MKDVPKARGHGRETPNASKRPVQDQVEFALTWLKRHRTRATRDGMAGYAIPSDHAYGVAMKDIKALSTMLGRNQPLAVALWATGVLRSADARFLCRRSGAADGRSDGAVVQGL
jgi:3-methyladenine DNA glycosylase AlkD